MWIVFLLKLIKTTFSTKILFFPAMKLFFDVNGKVNRYKVRNSKMRKHIIVRFVKRLYIRNTFFDERLIGETYLASGRNQLIKQVEKPGEGIPDWFQEDDAPAHFDTVVRDWLNDNLINLIENVAIWSSILVHQTIAHLTAYFWGMLKRRFTQ